MLSLNCTICQIPCPTIVTGSPTIILSVNRVVLKISRCDCCDHVPHPIVTPHLQGCYYTMTSVYHTNYHYPALLYSLMTSDQRVKSTLKNKNVSPLSKLYPPWTTSDYSTSTTHFIAHPMACIAGMISIFYLHNTLNYHNTNIKKY